jgi:hypothetical protein
MKRVLLGMPSYGKQTAAAGRALWRASSGSLPDGEKVVVDVTEGVTSLLACNFNGLWAQYLNATQRGQPYDYFAMLHDDCQPHDGWIDILIAELEFRKLDVLGVVSPIKDQNGLTSIALQRPDGDTWRPHARLTMHEIYRLPETFTELDVGFPLLLNTGCWITGVPLDTAKKLHFTINDRIVQKPDGTFAVEVEPEDWFFSRLCHEHGLRLGVTRKVHMTHQGVMDFSNREPWGRMQYDKHYVTKPVVPDDGFRFPGDVDGWLTYTEGRALFELARNKRVLEIGAYCGRSTICLAQSAESVVSLDTWDGRGTPKPRNTYDEFVTNCSRYGVANVDTMTDGGHYDLVFIDGDHSYDAVHEDIETATRLLTPGGCIAFHDYRKTPGEHDSGWDPGVTKAVDELLANGARLISRHGTVAVVKPTKELANV